MSTTKRCGWAGDDPLYVDYHDREWGVPLRDPRRLFEMLILEGAQAGLSWITILRKRQGYREAFDAFDAECIARYDDHKVAQLLCNPGIVRNRLKVRAAIGNARAVLELQQQPGGFSDFVWDFVNDEPVTNHWPELSQVPANTETSDLMSIELKKRGFRFVGSTICYAFMQSVGMVNDHTVDCFRHAECSRL